MRLSIGVDIGGTKIAFALVDEQGHVLATHRLPTQPAEGINSILDHITTGIQLLQAKASGAVEGIGIGAPGQVIPSTGTIYNAVNLGWKDVPIRDELAKRLTDSVPIWVHKDANAAAFGEMYFGAARGYKDCVLIAIGTGLGGGCIVGGEIVSGANSSAMEIGHISLDPNGRLCSCGMRGCPEQYVSGIGLLAGFKEHRHEFPDNVLAQKENTSTQAILEAAHAGDPFALAVTDEAARWLGITMAYCATALNPALFVIGGGLGHAAFDLLLDGAERELRSRPLLAAHEKLRIVEAQVESSAVGAACLVWHALKVNPASA